MMVLQDFLTPRIHPIRLKIKSNKLDPDEIGFGGILNEKIRDIATVKNGFEGLKVSEGIDYAVLESATKT